MVDPIQLRGHPIQPHSGRTNFTSTPRSEDSAFDGLKESPPIIVDCLRTKCAREFGPTPPQLNTLYIFGGAFLGAVLGVLFYKLHIGSEWLKLLSLPGDLYVRALRCLIVPMVFCVLTVVVADTVALGRKSVFRLRTLIPYLVSSIVAAGQGTFLAFVFMPYFTVMPDDSIDTQSRTAIQSYNLTLQCANGLYLAMNNLSELACTSSNSSVFAAHAITLPVAVGTEIGQLTLMDQITGIANLMISANIFGSLVSGSLLSIVFFSFPLGIVVMRSAVDEQENYVLQLIRQLRNIFLMLLYGLLKVTPVAVCFLMMSTVANFDGDRFGGVLSQVGFLCAAYIIGVVSHTALVLPFIVYLWTKANPYRYIKHLLPAYFFAFGCASSMATLPVTITCIQRAQVSRALSLISMPFGTPVNLNGCALYYPMAVVFMACMSGNAEMLTLSRWIIIFIVGWLGSMGTAPVPNAGLVYIITLWKTCFPSDALPPAFALLVAADFIRDRISTMVNVHGNAMVTRILADQVDEAFEVQAAAHLTQ